MAETVKPVILIMAGGSGTRFWPLSKPSYPKQFLNLFGDDSLIVQTAKRLEPISDQVYVCSIEAQEKLVKEHLPDSHSIIEPDARNTAPCLALSVQHCLKAGMAEETPMAVFPADQYIANGARLVELIGQAIEFCQKEDALVTLGIEPRSPHTGYGYIRSSDAGDVKKVEQFLEKPDEQTAKKLIASGDCYWNSGMFIWTLGSIKKAMLTHMPETWNTLWDAKDIQKAYQSVKEDPIDKAVMEKADNVYVIAADLDWSDVGSWNSLYEMQAKQPLQNILSDTNCKAIESTGCYVHSSGKKIAVVGLENVVVVESEGEILVCKRDKDQLVKIAAKEFPDIV